MKSIFKRIILLTIVLIASKAYTQTSTIIDYTSWNPSSPSCNVFGGGVNVPATIGTTNTTIYHGTIYGQPQYNTSISKVELPVNYVNVSDTRGTQYRINYNFKLGYSYKIVVNAAEKISTQGQGNPLYLRLAPSNSSGSSNAPCTGPDNRTLNISGAQDMSGHTTFTDYTIQLGTLNVSSPSLDITAYPSYNGGQNAIEIAKITITETAPPVSFTLPSTTNVQCGSTSPITFTVTNGNNTPNVTDYTWNLGTTPNGWLYNGSPAPQTVSTGTTNSITLTPICGSTLSNISAAVTAGGNIYNTNPSTINRTTPSLSITGNNAICTGSATYSIANLPCDASVTWAASPSGIVSLSCTTCSSTTLTKTGSGNVTLTATVTTSCGNQTITKTIGTGNTVSGYYNVISNYTVSYNNTLDYGGGSVFLPKNQSVLFSIQLTSTDLTSVSWGVSGTYSSYYSGSNFLNLYMMSPSSSWSGNNATVTLNATGPCGSFSKSYNFQAVANGSFSYSMKASPNPAKNNLNITLDKVEDTSVTVTQKESLAKPNATTGITRISLYDFYTNALVKQWTYNDISTMNYNLNISGLHKGLYLLKLERENKTTTTKVVVK